MEVVRYLAGKRFQGGVASRQKPRLPIIEGTLANVRNLTRMRNVTRRLPGLEQEPSLRRRRAGEVGTCHAVHLGLSRGYRTLLLVR